MSRFAAGFIGVTVAALALGTASIQIASGHDLSGLKPTDASLRTNADIVYDVNRVSKADRNTTARSDSEGPTIVFQHPHLPSTTIAAQVRQDMPAADNDRAIGQQGALRVKKLPARQKIAAACERNVSALSEVAKLMDAGRCIT